MKRQITQANQNAVLAPIQQNNYSLGSASSSISDGMAGLHRDFADI